MDVVAVVSKMITCSQPNWLLLDQINQRDGIGIGGLFYEEIFFKDMNEVNKFLRFKSLFKS